MNPYLKKVAVLVDEKLKSLPHWIWFLVGFNLLAWMIPLLCTLHFHLEFSLPSALHGNANILLGIRILVGIAYSIKVLINCQFNKVDYQLNWILAFLFLPLLAIPYYTYLQRKGKPVF